MVARHKSSGARNGNGTNTVRLSKGNASALINGSLPLILGAVLLVLVVASYVSVEIIKTISESNTKLMSNEVKQVGRDTVAALTKIELLLKDSATLESVRRECMRLNSGGGGAR